MFKLDTLVCLATVLFTGHVLGSVYEAYPVNDQLPPVARINEEFQFELSNGTYKSTSDSAEITYEAFELPTWLSFDSSSKTFSGTVNESFFEGDETRYFDIVLQGTDSEESLSLNVTYQFVASTKSGVSIADNFNLLNLLKNYGSTNGKDALKLSPNDIFNVTFERSDFTVGSNDSVVTYYGRSQDFNAPLPNWLFFDESNLKFSGTAPVVNSEIAPETDYSFVLIATDIDGYSGASIDFQIVVGAHSLTTAVENTLVINITDSGSFSYDIPWDYIYLDGSVINSTDVAALDLVDAPSWVSISDNQTLVGTLPSNTTSVTFELSIYDVYYDTVYLSFVIESTQDLFAVEYLSNVNVTRDEWFEYSLLPSQFTSYNATTVSATFNSTADWLSFQSSNLTFLGFAPSNFQNLEVNVTASKGSTEDSLNFTMIGINRTGNTTNVTSSITSTTSTAKSSSTASTAASSSSAVAITSSSSKDLSSKSNKKVIAIACGVTIPVVIILLTLLLFFLWRRRRNNKDDTERSAKISSPDTRNPANDPSGLAPENPFSDDNTLDEVHSTEAKRLATLNAMKLDDLSNSSTMTSLDEKTGNEQIYQDALMANSRDMLLNDEDEHSVFNDKYRSSSLYFQDNPGQRKSWRYSKNAAVEGGKTARQSYASLNTVSTQELLNSEIKENTNLPRDPRKSSLGLRDSAFWTRDSNANRPSSQPIDERDEDSQYENEKSTHTSVSSDEFIPVKQEDGNYKWVPNERPVRRTSTKRLVTVSGNYGVNVGNADSIKGEEPERTVWD